MTLAEAVRQAQAISIDNQCGQHVNRRLDGSYYTSDWYNADSTVMTIERGKLISEVRDVAIKVRINPSKIARAFAILAMVTRNSTRKWEGSYRLDPKLPASWQYVIFYNEDADDKLTI